MPPPPDWLSWLWANREEIVRLLTLIGGAIGIYFLAIRTRAADRTARAALDQAKTAADQAKTAADRHEAQTNADRERRITESFAKAVEQLGSDKLETRLGAIYTLERIAGESEREYWPIMETLTAFVREHAPWPPRHAFANPFVELQSSTADERTGDSPPAEPEIERPATDIQAILIVLGRRDEQTRKRDEAPKRHLDLRAIDLRGANFEEAHLDGATFVGTHLEGANLGGAHLKDANLSEAYLEDANLSEAYLEGANLGGAHLKDAHLQGARLESASLVFAHLEGAHLGGAHLENGHLSVAHLEDANLEEAHLEGAHLGGAHLEGANLAEAHLEGANLAEAHLEGADLWRAYLEGAHLVRAAGLTQGQLDMATGDDSTDLPEGLTRPVHWSAPLDSSHQCCGEHPCPPRFRPGYPDEPNNSG